MGAPSLYGWITGWLSRAGRYAGPAAALVAIAVCAGCRSAAATTPILASAIPITASPLSVAALAGATATVPAVSPSPTSLLPPTPSPSPLPTGYSIDAPSPTTVNGYPGPINLPTAAPTATSTPLVAPTVTAAANAISPDNAADLRPVAAMGPPSFQHIKQFFADNSMFSGASGMLDTAYSLDGTELAVAEPYGVFIYDLLGLKPLRFIDTANAFPFRVSFLADSQTLMVSNGDFYYWPLGATFFDAVSGQRTTMIRVGPAFKPEIGTVSRVSPDGRTLVIQQGNLGRLYDPFVRRPLPFWPAWVSLASYAFSPDGRLLAAGFGAVTVWDLATHRVAFNATERGTAAIQKPEVAFSPDGGLFATTDARRLVVWDVPRTQKLFDVPFQGALSFGGSPLVFSPDGQTLLIAGDGQVVAWRVPGGELALKTMGTGALFSPDSSTLAISADHHAIAVWDVASAQQRFKLTGEAPQFAPDGRLLIKLGAWSYAFTDARTGQAQTAFFAVRPTFAPDGRLLDIGDDASVRILDGDGQPLHSLGLRPEHSPMTSLAFLNDGRLVMAFGNGTVRLQTDDPQLVNNPFAAVEQGAWIYQVVAGPDGQSVLSASKDGTLARFISDGYLDDNPHDLFGGPPGELTSVTVSPDGHRVAAGSSDGSVKLWDATWPAITPTQTLAGHASWVWSVAFSPDGAQLASGSADHTVRVWNAATGTSVRELTGDSGPVHSVAYSPDGALLASGAWDGTVRLWDAADGGLVRTLRVAGARVTQVSFSRDGQIIAAGADDGTVHLWETTTGRSLVTLHPTGGAVWGIAFSPDGRRLAAAMNDGVAQIWEAP